MRINRKAGIALTLTLVLALLLFGCDPPSNTDVDATYSEAGPYTTTSDRVSGFTIYYPQNLERNHPIITWGNGTGAPTQVYSPLLRHLASWGFVVIATDSVMTQSGAQMINGVEYLITQNRTSRSQFYGKLDTNHIGATGHSQGGGGTINAATDPRVTCCVPIAPSPGSIRNVKGPVFLVAGSTDGIVSASLVRSTSYAPADGPTVFGIVSGMGHMSFAGNAGNARGYITAWFMYHLQDDDIAGEAFIGDCEICSKSNWNVQMKNFP